MTGLAGRNAVVTGGGGGIGRALALHMARAGARIAVTDIGLDRAEETAAAILAEGGFACAIHCDVSDRGSVQAMADAATVALGPVSMVVANAGVTSFDPLVEMADDDVDWIVQVNLMGVPC